MPFSSNPLLAPVFQSPVGDAQDHRPPVVSIKRAEDAVESGIRLHHNQRVEGYILQPEVEGLGVAPVELQTAPLASGGSVARHSRLTEGDVFLPITLVSPVPSALPSMFDALVDIARPGQRDEDGLPYQFEVVVFDPYGQETRSRRLIFESGLGDPVRVNHHVWRTSITGRLVDPFWYGQVRELRRTLGNVDKKFITAKQGEPDPNNPSITYRWEGARHASPSVKLVDGDIVARNVFPRPSFEVNDTGEAATTPNINLTTFSGDSFIGNQSLQIEDQIGDAGYQLASWDVELPDTGGFIAVKAHAKRRAGSAWLGVRVAYNLNGWEYSDADWRAISSNEWRETSGLAYEFPAGVTLGRVTFYISGDGNYGAPAGGTRVLVDGVRAVVGSSAQDALDLVETYWDGDTPDEVHQVGGYEFPFFPVRIGGSVVQGEYELQVEGDAPAYWSGVITPPGEDLLIQNAQGERIFVQGRVDEPILIQTRPQEQDITLADGTPIWDRIDPGDDDFFPLHPGKNTVHVSMVGATQQSEILIRYREAFFHALGGGR